MFVQVLLIVAVMLTVTMLFYQWFGRKFDEQNKLNRAHELLVSHNNSVEALSFGYPKAIELILNANDYTTLKEAFREADYDWQQRAELCIIARRGYHPDILNKWVNEQPTADAFLTRGISLLQLALINRQNNPKEAEQIAQEAVQNLTQSAQQLPHDPTPWAYLISIYTDFPQLLNDVPQLTNQDNHSTALPAANNAANSDIERLYHHAKQLDHSNWLADFHYAISLSPFSAINEENENRNPQAMLNFAEQLANELEEGNPRIAIIFRALIDYFRWQDWQAESNINVTISEEHLALGEKYGNKLLGDGLTIEESPTQFFAYSNAAAWFWMCRDQHKLPLFLSPINDRIRPVHWQWQRLDRELFNARKLCQLPEPIDQEY